MADELNWMSAAKLVKAYKKKKLSPVEVTRACLARIARHEFLFPERRRNDRSGRG
jgi:Asp-tRNA(Asn)/Glu-tRNA(Gln) amidotransferase A subunit family amidase